MRSLFRCSPDPNFSDQKLDEIDNMRGSFERDDFLRLALQMGLGDFRTDSTLSEQDNLRGLVLAQTQGFQQAKSLRRINAADTKHEKKKEA